jgi:RNA polymerase sigma-70 factor (ECF subfamily)
MPSGQFFQRKTAPDMNSFSPDSGFAVDTGLVETLLVDRLYRQYRHGLIRYLGARFGRSIDLEDIVQSTFLKLADQPGIDRIADHRSYIFTVACNIAIDTQRKVARRGAIQDQIYLVRSESPILAQTSEKILLDREDLGLVETALRNMPKLRRRIFLLIRIEGLSVRDVAARFAMTEAAVYKHVGRAIADCAAMVERSGSKAGHRG